MFVHFRKRFPDSVLNNINDMVVEKANYCNESDEDVGPHGKSTSDEPEVTNKGKLLVDATCAPADITFPTDVKLLNKAREKSEEIIDVLHNSRGRGYKKPRTYRQKTRKQFLAVSKSRRVGRKKLRRCLRGQLGYLRRNLKSIEKLSQETGLSALNRRQYRELLIVSEVYRQQKWMYDHHSRRIDDRIVSTSQPHVRPIKRGKAGSDTEFGAKLSVSLVNGYGFVDRISWDNFNEGPDLIDQIEKYKQRSGYYPESVHADKIYRNRDNLRFCKKNGIRLSGPRLGRPPNITTENAPLIRARAKQAWQDELYRIPIEGKFGQGKRNHGLGRILTKLPGTSETAIILTFLVMNLEKWLAAISFFLFFKEQRPVLRLIFYVLRQISYVLRQTVYAARSCIGKQDVKIQFA
jgi:hypothetical protein